MRGLTWVREGGKEGGVYARRDHIECAHEGTLW